MAVHIDVAALCRTQTTLTHTLVRLYWFILSFFPRYEYAMVLSYGASLEDPDRGFQLQAAVMARLLRAGIQAVVLESTVLTHNRLCLLLKPTDVRLQAERLQLRLDRWFVQRGGDGELPESIIRKNMLHAGDLLLHSLHPAQLLLYSLVAHAPITQ